MRKIILFAIVAFMAFIAEVEAQDPHFSQFYANPLYVNPALAGSNVCPRLGLSVRDQWPSLGAFQTATVSYDQYVDFLNGGVGAIILGDKAGDAFRNVSFSLMYSLRLKLTKKVNMNLALQAAIANRSLDFTNLTFADMIDPRYGFIYSTRAEVPQNLGRTYVDFAAGTVVYGENWYGGAAFAHLTRPDDGFVSSNRLPMKITVHGGMKLNISRDKRRTNAFFGAPIISPNVIYNNQGQFHDLNYGLYLDWSPFIVGAWFRQGFNNPDAFVFMAGVQYGMYKFGYSYDITVSSLSNVSGGAHEISFGVQFNCPEKRKKLKSIDCPSF